MTVKYSPPENHYIQLDIVFATEYGTNQALIFAKLHRLQKEWQGKVDKDGNKWIRLTIDEWATELPFMKSTGNNTIRRTLKDMVEKKLIAETVFSGRSKWYRCNEDFVSNQNGHIANTTNQNDSTSDQNDNLSNQNGHLPNSFPNSFLFSITTTEENLKNLKIINSEAETEAALKALTTNYEDAVSVSISQILSDEFKLYALQVKPEWVVNAFKATVSANVQNWNYPRKILDECIKAGAWVENKPKQKQQRTKQNGKPGQSAQSEYEKRQAAHLAEVQRVLAERKRQAAV